MLIDKFKLTLFSKETLNALFLDQVEHFLKYFLWQWFNGASVQREPCRTPMQTLKSVDICLHLGMKRESLTLWGQTEASQCRDTNQPLKIVRYCENRKVI